MTLEAVWDLFYFSSSLRASSSETFAGIPFSLILLDWKGWLKIIVAVLKAFSKPAGRGLAIEEEILALLEGLAQAKALGFCNFLVEGDATSVISWATRKERGPWKFDGRLRQIIDISSELGCSFS